MMGCASGGPPVINRRERKRVFHLIIAPPTAMVALKNYFFKVGSYSYDMHRMVFDVSTLGYIQRTQVNYQLVLVLFHLRVWFLIGFEMDKKGLISRKPRFVFKRNRYA